MGTASSGGSGGGSGMRSGGGDGGGGYYSSDGNMSTKAFDAAGISAEVGKLFKGLFSRASAYMQEMFDNPYITNVYLELFTLSSLVRNQNSVEAIGERYKIDMDEPLFILNLLDKFREKYQVAGVDSRCIDAVRLTLESFLFKAVDDDPILSIDGNGRDVVNSMSKNADFWKRLSGNFLLYLTVMVYKKDTEAKTPKASFAAEKEIEKRTNQIITSYEQLSGGRETDYTRLFEYIGQNWEWFKKEMTR
jgi:hypothetical protein